MICMFNAGPNNILDNHFIFNNLVLLNLIDILALDMGVPILLDAYLTSVPPWATKLYMYLHVSMASLYAMSPSAAHGVGAL